ncbi:putative calpain [Trypanosoma conorhini]|uniref:Putative calpain n=1 Tax=Trypanosoma conorhini TaxID=83891 RepID=A0A422QAD4_9TRYP|nr:putative calpain [Trypanosoma conorhini]RNF26914.1 putative calpain [Trypanosoma conorhini]
MGVASPRRGFFFFLPVERVRVWESVCLYCSCECVCVAPPVSLSLSHVPLSFRPNAPKQQPEEEQQGAFEAERVALAGQWKMTTLDDLYASYCRRRGCKPNSSLSSYLQEEFARHNQQRVLESVDLSKNYVGAKGIIPVLDLVKNVKTVKRLDVRNNMLEHEQLQHLVYCLALHPSMEEVDVSGNALDNGSVDLVLQLLRANENITAFHVGGNHFSPASLSAIDECLERNRERKAARQREVLPSITKKFFRAQVRGLLEEATSGGHVHYATWWKNQQYVMRTSRGAQVRIVMDIDDPKAARQAGFFVFHSDGTRKVIEADAEHIAAESNVDHSHCFVTMWAEEHAAYAIMPFTFHPERGMSFTLTAEICQEYSSRSEAWVTLEPVDPALDWLVYVMEGEWTPASAGGSPAQHLWCRNPMIHVQYDGSLQAHRMASLATLFVQLSKSVEADVNDDRRIGFDVVALDATAENKPPVYCTDEVCKCTCPHAHRTTVAASFGIKCAALDLFIVPSTETPGELGPYTVTVFSSVPLRLTTSVFPHGWNYRAVNGVWDEDSCGGSREHSMSWKCNPSVALRFDAGQPPPGLILFMEGFLPNARSLVCCGDGMDACGQPVDSPAMDEEEQQQKQEKRELKEFLHRHRVGHLEGCISLVDAAPPLYRALYSSECSGGSVARLVVPAVGEDFFLLATTRHAGQLGSFTLHIFSPHPFVADEVRTLALREREYQLLQHTRDTQARQAAMLGPAKGRPGLEAPQDTLLARNEILRRCMVTGEKYVDRDFPRGGSSLWVDPEAKTPAWCGEAIYWKRPTELVERVTFLKDWRCDCPFPFSRREWFASVTHAIATKPRWLQTLSVSYDAAEGLVQFRFFKSGQWTVVGIDDYLPCDNTMELCMGRPSSDKSDFFFPLLEKAYAKLHRCYEALERRVTPELRTVEVMCHGLMDLSGCAPVHFPLRCSVELTVEQQNILWAKLKNAIQQDVLFTFLLRSDTAEAAERISLGILGDHLYPVLDARFVEGQRLVKLRHWGQETEINWGGKWRARSPRWTPVLRELLQFDEADKETFWLSLDETFFYFTDLIMTAGVPHTSWVSANFSDCPKDGGGGSRLLEGAQFTLRLGDFPPDVKRVQITLGLHQPDARARVIRKKGALATYRAAVGLAVVATADNTVWLKEVADADVVKYLEPCKGRDLMCPLTVDMENVKGKERLTLIAFREEPTAASVPFLLSAWSDSCEVALAPIERDVKTTVSGEWPLEYPVGSPASSFWRDCPQYFVFPSESTDVSLVLRQEVAVGELPKPIGFTVHRATKCRSYLEYDPATVELRVQAAPSASVEATMRLLGMKERRGMPYIIVPFCTEATAGGKFWMDAIANRSLRLCRIEPRLDWHRGRKSAAFKLADASFGGSPRFSSWRSSPQFALTFPVGGQGRLFLVLRNDDVGDKLTEVGMTLLRGDNAWENGQRRKLVISPADIVARSEEKVGETVIDCEIDVQPECTLILAVYASMPYREAAVTMAFYSASAVVVAPVREWAQVAVAEGSWELGYTAGGGSEEFGGWINNPFVALNTFRQTQIVALLLQYPRGPEKPIVKRAGNKKAFLPPIIINPNNRMEIALDLNTQNTELTPIAATPYTRNSEVALVASVPVADPLPFLFIPHTKLPEGNGDFKLFVYADSPIELYTLTKERLPYV